MTDYQRSLTASNILYLLAMREIDKSGEGMRCTRIANMLNLSKPSVHSMMNVFTEMGLISRGAAGVEFFTEHGRETAARIERYYNVVSRILCRDFPGISDIKGASCALISGMENDSLDNLCRKESQHLIN